MEIRKAEKQELKELIPIYKDVFKKHNIFKKPDQEVQKYLEAAKGIFLVAVEYEKIVGGLLIVIELSNPRHKRTRFKHIAVAEGYRDKGIGSALLKAAEKLTRTGKVEIHLSENEKDALNYYKKNGYKIEGKLSSHYRLGEICYILGKEVEQNAGE